MDLITQYALDTENPEVNYELAKEYEKEKQYAAAWLYYFRCAERTENDLLGYKSLIRASICIKKQSTRRITEKTLLQHAINLLPKRPEAYYNLSLIYEKDGDWQNCYTYSNRGLNLDPVVDIGIEEYQGLWLLMFQKSIAAWHWGKCDESRKILWDLVDNYWEKLDDIHKKSVEKNISMIGLGPNSQGAVYYKKEDYQNLRFPFKGKDKVDVSYAQIMQDIFVLCALDGKENGTFLEIGTADPTIRNNTYLLESKFGWTGAGIELNNDFYEQYRIKRPNIKLYNEDATKSDYSKILKEIAIDSIVDYLQLDIEPARNTYECLEKIPFEEYRFRVITFEHDHYVDITKNVRQKSREFLIKKGYVNVANDLSADGKSSFEDWWVHPELIDANILMRMEDVITGETRRVDDYLLKPQIPHYYGQYNTDSYIRENFFPDYDYKGVMVEVGAGPPTYASNSKHFRDSGWRTIGVEPNPKFVEQHKKEGSEVYQYACCDKAGTSEFTINLNNDDDWHPKDSDGISFSALKIRYDGVPEHNSQSKIEVETIRLDSLLESLDVEYVDVLSIDVEGWELDVLNGLDKAKYQPKIIVIENLENNSSYPSYMNERGYDLVHSAGCNEFYKLMKTKKIHNTKLTVEYAESQNTLWIVDDFYSKPNEIRQFALEQDYHIGGIGRGYIGNRTHQQFLFPGLKERFESIMGRKITRWEEWGMNGRFQYCWSGQPQVWHNDCQMWGGMIYLTPNAPYDYGTSLYANKDNKARNYKMEGWNSAWQDVPGDPHLDGSPFEVVDVAGNVFNRLVIFDASNIHASSGYFGTVKENCRLWQMFFFDTEW